jgi:SAM-dependent methyltransferase
MSTPSRAWFRDPDFWDVMHPFAFPEARLDAADGEVGALTELVRRVAGVDVGGGTRVLDMPCGPGRHAVSLAEAGCEVVGVDLMPRHIDMARARAEARGVDVDFRVGDMFASSFPDDSFDLALNLFTSIGYTDDPEDDYRLMCRIREALRPGGALVIDTMGKEVLARDFKSRRYFEAGGWVVHETVSVEDAWHRVVVELRFQRDGDERVAAFGHRVYGASDLARILVPAGFVVSFFGGLDGRPYDHDAERLVAVAVCSEDA